MLARDFNIPYELVQDYLSHDLDQVVGNWMRTMVPDTLLHERFPGEGPKMTSAFRKIEEEYDRLGADPKLSVRDRQKLNAEKGRMLKTLKDVMDRYRGVVNNTEGMSGRIGEVVRRSNQMSDLGFAAFTSIPDFAGPIFHHGITNVLRDAWLPLEKGLKYLELSKRELRAFDIGTEIENSTRGNAMAELNDNYSPKSKLERGVKYLSDRFFIANLQAPETNAAKRMAGRVAMNQFLHAIKAEAEGVATAAQKVALRESNIDEIWARKIWDEFSRPDGGTTFKDGTLLSNSDNWVDQEAKMRFAAVLHRDVERAVVTPGAEKPIWLSTNAGSLLGQFKTFSFASGNKILISSLQRRDAQTLQGLVTAVALGVISYRITTLIRGDPWPERTQDIIKEGVSRAGITGPIEDANMFLAKASRGTLDMYRLIGADKPLSRGINRSLASSVLGPTFGKVENIAKVTGAVGSGEWSAADAHAMRRIFWTQNLHLLHPLWDELEQGQRERLGIPEPPPRTR